MEAESKAPAVDETVAAEPKTVLVTGATGFIAGHVVQQLLLRGYKVRGTVRYLDRPESFAFLSRIHNAASNLSLVQLDIRLPKEHEQWAAAFDGVDFVFHLAGPTDLRSTDPQTELIDPILNGTRCVMQWAMDTKTVQRVLLTSCSCAICDEFAPGKLYTEVDWNEKATADRNPFAYAKTLAENEAWAMMTKYKCHFDLVTLLPGTVLGPHLNGGVSQSQRFILALLDGTMRRVPNLTYAIADVRDIAACHIICLEKKEANGRYYCATLPVPLVKILQIIHENFSDLHVPSRPAPDGLMNLASGRIPKPLRDLLMLSLSKPPHIATRRAKKIGMYFRGSTETIVDTCRYFIESNNIQLTSGGASCAIL